MKLKPTLSLKLSCSTLGRLKTWCMITKHVYVSVCKAYTWFACTHAGKGFGSPRWLRSVNSTARKPPKASLKSRISTVILGWTCPRKTFPYSKVKYIQGFQGKLWATLMLSCLYIICKYEVECGTILYCAYFDPWFRPPWYSMSPIQELCWALTQWFSPLPEMVQWDTVWHCNMDDCGLPRNSQGKQYISHE